MEYGEYFAELTYWLNGPVICVMFVFGTILNFMTMFILIQARSRSKLTSSSHYKVQEKTLSKESSKSHRFFTQRLPRIYIYFVSLVFCDIILLIFIFLNYSMPTLFNSFAGFYARLIPVWYTCSHGMFTFNFWLMIILIVERYRLLCRKFATTVGYKPKNIYFKLVFTLIASFLFASLRFFELDVIYIASEEEYTIQQTYLANHPMYMLFYRIIGSLVFHSFIPYLIIFFYSIKIWLAISNSNKEQARMNVIRESNTDSDRILMALSVRFLISRFPTTVLDIVELFAGSGDFFGSSVTMLFSHLSNFLVVISCAFTFFTFYGFSMKFRKSVKLMINK